MGITDHDGIQPTIVKPKSIRPKPFGSGEPLSSKTSNTGPFQGCGPAGIVAVSAIDKKTTRSQMEFAQRSQFRKIPTIYVWLLELSSGTSPAL